MSQLLKVTVAEVIAIRGQTGRGYSGIPVVGRRLSGFCRSHFIYRSQVIGTEGCPVRSQGQGYSDQSRLFRET